MYLQIDDRTGESAILSDGSTQASYQRAGLSSSIPDARYWPGRTELEPQLRNANTFPAEFTVEFVHTEQVYRFVRS
jgi:hypothetical protein